MPFGFSMDPSKLPELSDIKPLSERRGENMRILFLAAAIGLVLGGILVVHAFYSQRLGVGLHKASLGGGLISVAFGLVMLYSATRELAHIRAPRPVVRLTPTAPRAGGQLRVDWTIEGDAARVRTFRIELEGTETYGPDPQGRPAHKVPTYERVLATISVIGAEAPLESKGSARVTLPNDASPSSVSPEGNVVSWGIRVVTELTNGDTFEDNHPFTVRPPV